MRKLLLLLSVFFSSWLATSASVAEIIRASTLPGSRMEGLNVINFSVNAPVARDYYAQFWLIPPQHPDGSYTVYQVFLNGKKVGEIRPDKGNWQSIRIKGDPALSLREGDNVISVGTVAPELPQVESMKLVTSKSIEAFSSREYDNFVKKAKREEAYPLPPEAHRNITLASSTEEMELETVPLKYSFFSFFHFLEGENIFITTSSASEHDFDLVYYYSDEQPSVIIPPIIMPGSNSELNDEGIGDVSITDQKVQFIGTAATSAEMQGLNWKALSEPNMIISIGQPAPSQLATMQLDVPQSGYYLLRLRSRKNGTSAVANVNVNGNYYYSDIPISYTGFSCNYGIEGTVKTFTRVTGTANDPFLFIQGSDADRVVGYADDTPAAIQSIYRIKPSDAFIEQKYLVPTSAISVLNYWSQTPEGECSIYFTYSSGNPNPAVPLTKSQDALETLSLSSNSGLHQSLGIASSEEPIKVFAFDMAGNLICSAVFNAGEEISPRQVGISRPGFYFLRIESGSDVHTMKLRLKH